MKLVEPWDTGPEVPNHVWDCSGGMDLVLLQRYGIIYSKALVHLQNLLDGDGMLKISSSLPHWHSIDLYPRFLHGHHDFVSTQGDL